MVMVNLLVNQKLITFIELFDKKGLTVGILGNAWCIVHQNIIRYIPLDI